MLIFPLFLFPAAHGAISDTTNGDVSISPPPLQNETARGLYNEGTGKLRAGKLDDAETLLESSLAKQDERVQPAALFNLGDVRFDQGIEELKKSPDGAAKRTGSAIDIGTGVIAKATDALAGNDVQQMVDAYLAGRGAQKEMRAATQAVQRALEAHGKTLLKWRGALGDFQSAAELNPADTNASHNAEFAEQSIAKLVDSLREMQQAAANLSGKQAELSGLLQQLKGKIPAPNAPPGGDGEDENPGENGDHPLPESLKGLTESTGGGGGHEMDLKISPDEAGQLLNSIQPDGKNLPLGGNEPGQPNARSGRIW